MKGQDIRTHCLYTVHLFCIAVHLFWYCRALVFVLQVNTFRCTAFLVCITKQMPTHLRVNTFKALALCPWFLCYKTNAHTLTHTHTHACYKRHVLCVCITKQMHCNTKQMHCVKAVRPNILTLQCLDP